MDAAVLATGVVGYPQMDAIAESLSQLVKMQNPLLQWLPVAISLFALGAAVASAWSARQSTSVAQTSTAVEAYGLRQSQLEQLRARFERGDYFLRMWRLTMATSEPLINQFEGIVRTLEAHDEEPLELGEIKYCINSYTSLSPDALYIRPVLKRAISSPGLEHALDLFISNHIADHAALELVREALGPPWSKNHADMLGLYSFARAVNSWLSNVQAIESRTDRVRDLTFVFGPELVMTLSRHRLFAWRLHFGPLEEASFAHYRKYYGLDDPEYAKLIDELAAEAHAQNVLSDDNMASIARTEMLMSCAPDLLREPFPFIDWQVGRRSRTKVSTPTSTASEVA